MQRDIGGQGISQPPDQRRRVEQISFFRVQRALVIACADAFLQRAAIPKLMWQACCFHGRFQRADLLCTKISGGSLDATGNL